MMMIMTTTIMIVVATEGRDRDVRALREEIGQAEQNPASPLHHHHLLLLRRRPLGGRHAHFGRERLGHLLRELMVAAWAVVLSMMLWGSSGVVMPSWSGEGAQSGELLALRQANEVDGSRELQMELHEGRPAGEAPSVQ